MAIYFRHLCADCGKPVITKKGLDWSHVDFHVQDHQVRKIDVEKLADDRKVA